MITQVGSCACLKPSYLISPTTLHDNRSWPEHLHYFGHNGLEQRVEGLVVSAILQTAQHNTAPHSLAPSFEAL
jgi:hypothetical protein